MKETTRIDLAAAEVMGEKYDASCKAVWKNKEILAPLLQNVIQEYKGASVEDVIRYIDADTISEDVPVGDLPPTVIDRGTEFTPLTEKPTRFDLHFKAKNPVLSDGDLQVMLHIDVEFQTDYQPHDPSYPLTMRGIYYGARELERQLGTLTGKTNYADLEKVYSIWICSDNIPADMRGTMDSYHIAKKNLIGKTTEPVRYYDLIEVIMIRRGIGKETVLDYLEAVFNSDLQKIEKYVRISDKPAVSEEVKKMSGLGAMIYSKGVSQGISQGRMEGISQGRSQGEAMLSRLIMQLLADGRNADVGRAASDEGVRRELYQQYGITEEGPSGDLDGPSDPEQSGPDRCEG